MVAEAAGQDGATFAQISAMFAAISARLDQLAPQAKTSSTLPPL
jgi:hypothetical protein